MLAIGNTVASQFHHPIRCIKIHIVQHLRVGFLSGGCSKSPIDLLKGAGVDMSTTKPVEEALSLFGELIGEMEELMKD